MASFSDWRDALQALRERARARPFLAICRTVAAATLATGLFMALLGVLASGPALVRGPYLQLLTPAAVTVVWNTDVPAGCGLEIGPVGGPATVIGGSTGTVCAIAVDSLSPGARYEYTPLADGAPLGAASVFRADDPSRPFSFLVVGDSGSGGSKQADVRDAMQATPADFILHTGDMVYDDGTAEDLDPHFFAPYRDLIRRLVFWPCRGNHDVRTAGGGPWRDAFYTPANNPAGTEDYYSFDFGNAHIVVLDSNGDLSPGSAQHTFLDQDLAASAATWKFVAFHHSMYSSRRDYPDLKAALVPVFDRHRVDVVFMGHDHHYERTKLLRADQVVGPGQGTLYFTTGGGGRSIRAIGTSFFTAYVESAFHVTRVVVGGDWLLAQMVREDGAIRDSVTLEKGAAPPPAACGDAVVNQPQERCDGPDHAACPGGCAADCTCRPVCGDGAVNQPAEECDVTDDTVCPGLCLVGCRCGTADEIVHLAPIADTYVEDGTAATWDHGAADHLEADDSPVAIAYLKFDLGSVTAPITAATLILHATDGSPDGGTVYPVVDSGWIEGNQTGDDRRSELGPGLTFVDVDTSHDGEIDELDVSPYLPELDLWTGTLGILPASGPYRVDVTDAVQDGPGIYSFAVKSDASDRVTYASREHPTESQRPLLRLELALAVPCETTADCDDDLGCTVDTCVDGTCSHTANDGVCDDGQVCNGAERCDTARGCQPGTAPCDDGVACSVDLCDTQTGACTHSPDDLRCADADVCNGEERCDAVAGCLGGTPSADPACASPPIAVVEADVSVRASDPGVNFGAAAELWADADTAKQSFLRLRVSGIGARRVARARLRLRVAETSSAASDSGGRIHRISGCGWNELAMTWSTRPAIDGAVVDERGPVRPGELVDLDLTPVITADGTYCVALDSLSADGTSYRSREAGGGPQVSITLQVPCRSDADCDDTNPCTTDACDVATGACRSAPAGDGTSCAGGICCGGTCLAPACRSDGDCNDAKTCTLDRCASPGTCGASCTNTWPVCGGADGCCAPGCSGASDRDCRICGDGVCGGGGEDCRSCPADCRCQGKNCASACCGDGVCTGGENGKSCAADCR